MRRLLAAALLALAPAQAQAPAAADPWKPLRFLIGTWEAKSTGGDARTSGSYAFQLELRDHVLVRRSATDACKGPLDFDCEHGDILYIYPDGAGSSYKAIYFDNEGHVIHYHVSTPAAGSAILLSDEQQPGPQYRLIYEWKNGVMSGKFQIRPPGQPEFRSYLEWSGGGR